jgi:hypothetical protein
MAPVGVTALSMLTNRFEMSHLCRMLPFAVGSASLLRWLLERRGHTFHSLLPRLLRGRRKVKHVLQVTNTTKVLQPSKTVYCQATSQAPPPASVLLSVGVPTKQPEEPLTDFPEI